ncbi:MAG: BatA and WFA domain-containing protein [Clostridia bacterium]|nr:BatA and WFA domain-containing protein [Clostridia bacterium]
MSFQYPLGLLGLIGVPILILIYIIKSKFTEQTVSATYLWTLSERFLKKKRRDSKIAGLLSLILQILAVVLISITIAHPVFTLKGAANDYYFILDSTGSMQMVSENGKTRFENGKDKIREVIEGSVDGSFYTLVSVSNTTDVLFEKEDNREVALELLNKAEVGYGSANLEEARTKAQAYYQQNKGVRTFLVSDKGFEKGDNIELLNVSDGANNYALLDIEYEHSLLGVLTVSGKAVSYESDDTVEVRLFIDGETKDEYKTVLNVKKAEPVSFTFEVNVEWYDVASVKVMNQDNLMLDNEIIMYNVKSENSYKTLLVSKTPVFMETVVSIVSHAEITVISPDDYLELEKNNDSVIEGYDLYIFHSCNPKAVPRSGSVWFINATSSVENSGFGFQGEVVLKTAETIDKTKNSSTVIRDELLKDVLGEDIYISKYARYDTSNRKFYTLFTYDGDPVIFSGTNMHGNRQVVFAFDLHNSDFPLSADFVTLTKNLLDFSFPAVLDETNYVCGEAAKVNVVSGSENIRVESPSERSSYLSMNEAVGEFLLNEVGTYEIKVTTKDGLKTYRIYSSLPVSEQDPNAEIEKEFSLLGENEGKGIDGFYDKLIVFFICLAVIFVADWMVYCYDKYQLR